MNGSWKRTTAVTAGMLGLAAALTVLAVLLRFQDLPTTANIAQLLSVVLAVPPLATALIAWSRRSARATGAATSAKLREAEDVLVGLVTEQWKAEAALRSLDDPSPIPVQWKLTERDDIVHRSVSLSNRGVQGQVGSSEEMEKLIARFRHIKRRRVVILGGPGSGKTTLAVQMLRELLATRQDGEPVPVLLPVAGWDTETFPRLHDWLATRLRQDYPALRATEFGEHAPRALAARGRILPVLDGLDELPPAARRAVISALNRSMGEEDQLILTCRSEEFIDAVTQGATALTSTQVIEPLPLPAKVSADYLQKCLPTKPAPAWDQVLDRLRTSSREPTVLADVASTALGLGLLRTVYVSPGVDPAPLLDQTQFPTAAALRAHLFDKLIPVLIASRPPTEDSAEPFRPSRRLDPEQVSAWLGYLADYLNRVPVGDGRTGSRDFAWWQLAQHSIRPRTFSRTAGVIFGLTFGLAYWLADEAIFGFAVALTSWVTIALMSGVTVSITARSWAGDGPGVADLHLAGRIPLLFRIVRKNVLTLAWISFTGGVSFILPLALVLSSTSWSDFVRDLKPPELVVLSLAGVAFWLICGFGFGFARGFAEWVETPSPAGRVSTPMENWTADRALNLTRSVMAGVALASVSILIMLVFVVPGWLPSWFRFGRLENPITWLAGWLLTGLAGGLVIGRHHAWFAYLAVTHQLAAQRRLPRKLIQFLDDAHRIGLLRTVGPIYQFRHAELQDHLAKKYGQRP